MKKLFLITFLLLIHSFSSHGSPNGKGLMCECLTNCVGNISSNYMTFFFSKNFVKIKRFMIFKNKFNIIDDDLKSSISNANIILIGNSEFNWFILYRKTLKLVYNNPTIEDHLKPIFKCNVFGDKPFFKQQNELIKKLERRVNDPYLNERDNKI